MLYNAIVFDLTFILQFFSCISKMMLIEHNTIFKQSHQAIDFTIITEYIYQLQFFVAMGIFKIIVCLQRKKRRSLADLEMLVHGVL
jgi:hypothetical protein